MGRKINAIQKGINVGIHIIMKIVGIIQYDMPTIRMQKSGPITRGGKNFFIIAGTIYSSSSSSVCDGKEKKVGSSAHSTTLFEFSKAQQANHNIA